MTEPSNVNWQMLLNIVQVNFGVEAAALLARVSLSMNDPNMEPLQRVLQWQLFEDAIKHHR